MLRDRPTRTSGAPSTDVARHPPRQTPPPRDGGRCAAWPGRRACRSQWSRTWSSCSGRPRSPSCSSRSRRSSATPSTGPTRRPGSNARWPRCSRDVAGRPARVSFGDRPRCPPESHGDPSGRRDAGHRHRGPGRRPFRGVHGIIAVVCLQCGTPAGHGRGLLSSLRAAVWRPAEGRRRASDMPGLLSDRGRRWAPPGPEPWGLRVDLVRHQAEHDRHPVGDDDWLESLREGDRIRIGRWTAPFDTVRRYLVTGQVEAGRDRSWPTTRSSWR